MAISWDDFNKIWASTSPLTPYNFSEVNYKQGWNFVGATPPARQMWDSIQKANDEKFKFLRDNFGTPNMVTTAAQMTDIDKIYVYVGSEAGWNNGHWYYYDAGTSAWADGGVYNSTAFVTDTTLTEAGKAADAKAVGDALALKADLAGATFTGVVNGVTPPNDDNSKKFATTAFVNAKAGNYLPLSGGTMTGRLRSEGGLIPIELLTTGTDYRDIQTFSKDGNHRIGVIRMGKDSSNNCSVTIGASNTSNDAPSGITITRGTSGNPVITGITPPAGDNSQKIATTEFVNAKAENYLPLSGGTVTGDLSVTGKTTLTGNVTASGNVSVVGDIDADNITLTGDISATDVTASGDVTAGALGVSGATTLTGNVTAGADITASGDVTANDITASGDITADDVTANGNLSVVGNATLSGTSTAVTPAEADNSTNIATTAYVQTEIKPIEADVSANDKRISNIEKLLQGKLYDYETDTDSAYTKTVPAGAMPYAGIEQIGGKTLVWNQLVNSGATTVATISGHKYYTLIAGTASIVTSSGSAITIVDDTADMVCDLTLMFGSGNEPSTTADFTSMFDATHYAYNAGELLSAGVTEVVSKKADTSTIATYPIPAEVQALEGYGWSAGTSYNYVDFERKVFVKCVDKIVLDGTQSILANWRPSENGVGWLYYSSLTNNSYNVKNVVCDKLQTTTYDTLFQHGFGICLAPANNKSYGICIRQTDISLKTARDINNYLSSNPLTVYYELATPIEVDISQYLTDDNLIEVEAGGSLTFENVNGDDYRIPVPSTEEYMINLQEAVNNG